jgi:hypothetical protein
MYPDNGYNSYELDQMYKNTNSSPIDTPNLYNNYPNYSFDASSVPYVSNFSGYYFDRTSDPKFYPQLQINSTDNNNRQTVNNQPNLTDSNLTDSNLTDSNLTDSNLTDSNLTDSNLTDSNLTNPTLISDKQSELDVNHCLMNFWPVLLAFIVFILCILLFPQTLNLIGQYNEQVDCITNSDGRNPSCIITYYLPSSEIYGNYTCGTITEENYYSGSCPEHYTCERIINRTLINENKKCENYDLCKRFVGSDDSYYSLCCSKWYPSDYNAMYYSYYCVSNNVIDTPLNDDVINVCTNIQINKIFFPISPDLIQVLVFLIALMCVIIFVMSSTMYCVPKNKLRSSFSANIFFQANLVILLFILVLFFLSNYDIVINSMEYSQCYKIVNEDIFGELINNSIGGIIISIIMILLWSIISLSSCCYCATPIVDENVDEYNDENMNNNF